MAWLAQWLKEIIFVVLMAAFIDLLLPNRSMERYVKLVVSLLILLTLISPVMRIFSPEAEKKLDLSFMDQSGEESSADVTTEEILRQGEQLRMKREQEAMQWASEQAAKQMQEQIERETGQTVERVVVKLEEAGERAEDKLKSSDNADGLSIQAVEVYILQDNSAEEHGYAGIVHGAVDVSEASGVPKMPEVPGVPGVLKVSGTSESSGASGVFEGFKESKSSGVSEKPKALEALEAARASKVYEASEAAEDHGNSNERQRNETSRFAIAPIEPVHIEVSEPLELSGQIQMSAQNEVSRQSGGNETQGQYNSSGNLGQQVTSSYSLTRHISDIIFREWGIPGNVVHVIVNGNDE
ncbi:stage III sporulation protein AF [Paenibacillus fonticola]|uniref:stage III sporulation protein AF n=1 Tax=Paenibacillus fonticola TaxID=379896 RepID=UPI000375281D|nr:stage III sporulation protein AF [Paenibacillus fonticola]